MFAHQLSTDVTHGAVQQQWHAGKGNFYLRVRVYIDNETTPSIDYPVGLAHGAKPQTPDDPWGNAAFGRTHDSGFYNTYLIPFEVSIRVTLTCSESHTIWYMIRGMENAPLTVSGLDLPPSARLNMAHTKVDAVVDTLIGLVNTSGKSGMLRQVTMYANSSTYKFQEGCVSAIIDGRQDPLWLSSGLEDYFLGAYFHSMPDQQLPYSGFALNITPSSPGCKDDLCTNSMAAYRIHEHDPVIFMSSFVLRWIASSDNAHHNSGYCNYNAWPPASEPPTPPVPQPSAGAVTVEAL
eukprot:Hpha_TRINITY_DN23905_c0_g1::TRINITY_DN23905_c0_g1_i1::g.137841::m.137841